MLGDVDFNPIMPTIKLEDLDLDDFDIDGLDTRSPTPTSESNPVGDEVWQKMESQYAEVFRNAFFDKVLLELAMEVPLDDIFNQVEEEERLNPTLPNFSNDIKIENTEDVMLSTHDCMWAGDCADHPCKRRTSAPSPKPQQSLLKPSLKTIAVNILDPQTPPMSDDEEKNQKAEKILPFTPDYCDDNDEDDEDLRKYFGGIFDDENELQQQEGQAAGSSTSSSSSTTESSDEEDEEEQEEQPGPSGRMSEYPSFSSIRSNVYATVNDHSYHKDKNASMRMADLGIETPSDSGSEEEIDVVSITDKTKPTMATRINYSMPRNNHSMKERNHFQRASQTVQSGKGRRSSATGLKVMLPTRRMPPAPGKRRPDVKMPRNGQQYKSYAAPSASSYRRRRNYDSESEPEPSEKRFMHNNMERQRRIDLRNAFEYLRQLVPEVLKKERAAKVVILREAAKYCDRLTHNSKTHVKQIEDLKQHQERLRMRVSMLRRDLALMR